jgi:hypothetical protein
VDWVCGSKPNLDRSFLVVLKRFLGSMGLGRVFKRACFVVRGARLRVGSKKWGFRPSVKKANKSGLVPGFGSDSLSTGMGFDLSGQGVSSPSAAFSPVPKTVAGGFS